MSGQTLHSIDESNLEDDEFDMSSELDKQGLETEIDEETTQLSGAIGSASGLNLQPLTSMTKRSVDSRISRHHTSVGQATNVAEEMAWLGDKLNKNKHVTKKSMA